MRTRMTVGGTLLILSVASTALARDTRYMYPIDAVLNTPPAKAKLGTAINFYFGKQDHPETVQTFGEYVTNLKTNAFNKTDREACEWVFLGTMLSLRDRAAQMGADGVVNIRSFYKKNEVVSETEYECHAGALIAGVALKGTVVKFAK